MWEGRAGSAEQMLGAPPSQALGRCPSPRLGRRGPLVSSTATMPPGRPGSPPSHTRGAQDPGEASGPAGPREGGRESRDALSSAQTTPRLQGPTQKSPCLGAASEEAPRRAVICRPPSQECVPTLTEAGIGRQETGVWAPGKQPGLGEAPPLLGLWSWQIPASL